MSECCKQSGCQSLGEDRFDDICKPEFESIHTKLDKLDESIRGNGKPGIQLRLDRLESAEAVRSQLLWIHRRGNCNSGTGCDLEIDLRRLIEQWRW